MESNRTVAICPKCEGRLDSPPKKKPDDASICAARCGHVFHGYCLKEHWNTTRRLDETLEFLVPCPVCKYEYRPAIFELFLSTREISFIPDPEDKVEKAKLDKLYVNLDAISNKRDTIQEQLEKTEKLIAKAKASLQELRTATSKLDNQRNEAMNAYEQNTLDNSVNKKLAFEILSPGTSSSSTGEEINSLNKTIELIDISDSPQGERVIIQKMPPCRTRRPGLRNRNRIYYKEAQTQTRSKSSSASTAVKRFNR